MAFEVTGTGSPDLKALEGWGWGQQSTDTYNNAGWADADIASLTAFGHNSPVAGFPAFGLIASGSVVTQGGEFVFPAVTLIGESGGTQDNAVIGWSVSVTGTSLALGRAPDLRFPAFTLEGNGLTGARGTAEFSVPDFLLAGYGAGNAILSWPLFTLNGNGVAMETGVLQDEFECDFINLFPITWTVTGSGTVVPSGNAVAPFPSFTVSTTPLQSITFPAFWIDGRAA